MVVHHAALTLPSLALQNQLPDRSSPAWWLAYTPLHLGWAGGEAVLVFFVLSGLVLALPHLREPRRGTWLPYYLKRAVRLYVPVAVAVVDLDVDWLDVGSWPALAGTLTSDAAGNATRGLTVLLDSAGNVVLSDDPDHLVALVGVRDSVVVHTADVTLVCPVADAERVKQLLAEVEQRFGARFS